MKKFLRRGLTLMVCVAFLGIPFNSLAATYDTGVWRTITSGTGAWYGNPMVHIGGTTYVLGDVSVYETTNAANTKYVARYYSKPTVYVSTNGTSFVSKQGVWGSFDTTTAISKSVSGYNPNAYGRVVILY